MWQFELKFDLVLKRYLGECKPGELRTQQLQLRGDLHDLGDRVRRAEDEDVVQADRVEMLQLE